MVFPIPTYSQDDVHNLILNGGVPHPDKEWPELHSMNYVIIESFWLSNNATQRHEIRERHQAIWEQDICVPFFSLFCVSPWVAINHHDDFLIQPIIPLPHRNASSCRQNNHDVTIKTQPQH